jgi:acetyltransferase-like isoleucine patch superfamily enzyme
MTNQAKSLPLAARGQDVIIWPQAKIMYPEVISIGNSVIIDDFVFFMGGKKSVLGNFIHIGSFTSITGGGEFTMHDFAGLSGGVRIYTGNEDYSGKCLTNPSVPYPYRVPFRSFVCIEKHAIVGANTVVLSGVTIGEGAAIGANSLVTKDCRPWTIYAGSPCREIKPRPKDEILMLEDRLMKEVFDHEGNYIPKDLR